MKILKIYLFIFISSLFSITPCVTLGYDGVIVGKGSYEKVPCYDIFINSSNPQVKQIATKAFSLHGSFKPVESSSVAQYEINLNVVDNNCVEVALIGAGNWTKAVGGEDLDHATLKACDEAVKKILAIPGFFAGKLAFSANRGNREIYKSDILCQKVSKVTSHFSDSIYPHWSPDGNKILYTTYFKAGFMDLYKVDFNQKKIFPFATYRGSNTGGAFSPDGRRVAMILSTSGNSEVWISDTNGKSLKKLTNTKSTEASPSWSPNSNELVFTSDYIGKPQLYKIKIDASGFQRVPTNISGYCAEPDWNKQDVNKIAFTTASGRGFQIAVYDASKRSSEIITSGQYSCFEPKWLNDGRHIVFSKEIGKKRQLWIIDSLSKRSAPLTSIGFASCSQPDFIY